MLGRDKASLVFLMCCAVQWLTMQLLFVLVRCAEMRGYMRYSGDRQGCCA